jgi:hypothetical protein
MLFFAYTKSWLSFTNILADFLLVYIPSPLFVLVRVHNKAWAAWRAAWCPSELLAAAAASQEWRDPEQESQPEVEEISGKKKLPES